MRRFVTLVILLLFSIPFGVSISGCSKNAPPVFCNGGDSGITTGQPTTISLAPIVYGISLNFAQIGQVNTPSATDCKGSGTSVQSYTYGTTDMTIADVQPNTGRLCGGTWNRNTGGGIPDYTYCTPTNKSGTAYISASADGVTSNPLPIFVHPVVTSIVLGADSSPVGTAAITGYSITANIPTFTAPNSYSIGDVLSLYFFPNSTFFNGIANAIVVPYTAGITAYSITANAPTFTAANSFAAGQVVTLQNFPTSTFFNGITNAIVQAASLSATQFTVAIPGFTHANVSATETGTASGGLSSAQFTLAIPGFTHGNTSAIETGFAGAPDCPTNPTTGCCPLTTVGSPSASPYQANSCISQGTTAQLDARIYAGDPTIPANNISCQTGHLQFSAQGAASVVSIDPNGVATANQPGSVLITANIANAASSVGFFSTCPPASITLTAPGTTALGTATDPVVVNQNNTQPLLATAVDTLGAPLTGLSLEYVSTSPTTIPAGSASVTPPLAGATSISAICQPPNCNSSAYNQIGLFGNGKPITSNSLDFFAPGTNSTVLYMASTQSKYVESRDFTQHSLAAPFLLPFIPNSMVISNDGSTIYMGSSTTSSQPGALMVLSAVNTLSISRTDITQPGTVLAVSPDGSDIVIADPVKQIVSLESSSGSVIGTYGASCPALPSPASPVCRAQFAPDSQTVYITAGNQLLVYSTYTGWTSITPATPNNPLVTPVTDVAITVPSVGAYFAGPTTTARSYCPLSTATTVAGVAGETNIFYPPVINPIPAATTDRIAATNDGLHILGATATTAKPTLSDFRVTIPVGACLPNGQVFASALPTTPTVLSPPTGTLSATAITGVIPASDSSVAFITYTGSGGFLPAYAPVASPSGTATPGTVTYIPLSGGPTTAPIAGALSADNSTFYVGTSGDNLVHLITRGTLTDSSTLAPALTDPNGKAVAVDLMVQKPRKTT